MNKYVMIVAFVGLIAVVFISIMLYMAVSTIRAMP